MSDVIRILARLRSIAVDSEDRLDRIEAEQLLSEFERLQSDLDRIRARAVGELTRHKGRWLGPASTLVCQTLRWVVFDVPWPPSEGGPIPSRSDVPSEQGGDECTSTP